MTEIRHIVFDLGRVLIRWEPEIPYRRLIPDETARTRFLAEVCNHAWLLQTDRGATWESAEDKLIAEHPAEADLIRAFRRHHSEMLPGEIEPAVALAEGLIARGIDVTALTNWAPDTFPEAEQRFPILSRFRGVTVSGRVGLVKPDLAIYRLHARAFGLDPPATLFFDDNPKNVEAAREAGWKAEVVTDPDRLRADLEQYGFPPP
jgi:2-haloacid dehalogenase